MLTLVYEIWLIPAPILLLCHRGRFHSFFYFFRCTCEIQVTFGQVVKVVLLRSGLGNLWKNLSIKQLKKGTWLL